MSNKPNPPSLIGVASRPFTISESEAFSTLLFAEMRGRTKVYDESSDAFSTFAGKILLARLNFGNKVSISETLALFVLFLSDSPGIIVLWAYTLLKLQQQMPGTVLNLQAWSKMFPNGIPTDTELARIWDAQKSTEGQNLLDCQESWTY